MVGEYVFGPFTKIVHLTIIQWPRGVFGLWESRGLRIDLRKLTVFELADSEAASLIFKLNGVIGIRARVVPIGPTGINKIMSLRSHGVTRGHPSSDLIFVLNVSKMYVSDSWVLVDLWDQIGSIW